MMEKGRKIEGHNDKVTLIKIWLSILGLLILGTCCAGLMRWIVNTLVYIRPR
jgi:hypothetical protein